MHRVDEKKALEMTPSGRHGVGVSLEPRRTWAVGICE